jgi:molybdopterin/thiamine biosynthesis adenylyltransferase
VTGGASTARAARRLAGASVVIVGAGALGCAAAAALAEAGVGRLALVDPDRVELSNLHRQLLHRTEDLGRPKVESAAAALAARHRNLAVTPIEARLDGRNAAAILPGHACVIDATDGLETKFLVNDEAVRLGLPLVHGGIVRFLGQLLTVLPGRSACYRCLFGAPPDEADVPSCREAGVLGALAGTIGVLQAAEAIRVATGAGPLLCDRLLTYDGLAGRWRQVRLRRDPRCTACGAGARPDAAATAPA